MKKKGTTILFAIIFLVGLSLLLYPTVSNYWNELHQSRAVAAYVEAVAEADPAEYDRLWQEAAEFNKDIAEGKIGYILTDTQKKRYESLLDISGAGVMGYVDVPSIGCTLPIYHGTDESVLQVALGHVEWSSLPVGGAGTHCVISGHRGLPSAKLFTNLDELTLGDTFTVNVLNQTLTYEVDRILIVLPDDLSSLKVEPGMDYCTLVTCTPYGVNTHRLLVRGHRIDNAENSSVRIVAEATQVGQLIVAAVIFVPLILLWLICSAVIDRKRRKHRFI